jgi:AraC-like DNA-binding protein
MSSSIVSTAWTALRSASSAAILAKFAVESGLPLAAALAGSRILTSAFDDPHAEIESWQELAMIRNITRALGSSGTLGARIGRRYHLTSQGTFGFALLGAPTVRQALQWGLRYEELGPAFARFRLEESAGEARLICDDEGIPDDVRFFVLNRDAAALRTMRREIVSAEPSVQRICVREPRPPDADALNRFWGMELEFGASCNMCVFHSTYLDTPLPQANAQTVRWCETQCREVVARRRGARGLAAGVREKLLAGPPYFADMETTARQLAMTSRTLRRRLAAEGTTFRKLVDDLRLTLAKDFLQSGDLSATQIADRLGYADASSLFHAFKRLTGSTPRNYWPRVQPPTR